MRSDDLSKCPSQDWSLSSPSPQAGRKYERYCQSGHSGDVLCAALFRSSTQWRGSLDIPQIFLDSERPFQYGDLILICIDLVSCANSAIPHRVCCRRRRGVALPDVFGTLASDCESGRRPGLPPRRNNSDVLHRRLFFCWPICHVGLSVMANLKKAQRRGETHRGEHC